MYKTMKPILALIVLSALLFGCAAPALAEGGGQTVNILLLVGDDAGEPFYPCAPILLTLDFEKQTIRIVNFYFQSQITAVTRLGGEMDIPMDLLKCCETGEIVKAFENTYGIVIDRYLIFLYSYGSFQPAIQILDKLCPMTLSIPEELLGDEEYISVNANMQWIAGELGREYTPVTQAGPQALDSTGVIGYFAAIAPSLMDSYYFFDSMTEDYEAWDAKNRAMLEAIRSTVAQFTPDDILAMWTLLTQGQQTDITAEDITSWTQMAFNFPADGAYLTIPGFEGVEEQFYDTEVLTDKGMYGYRILRYDVAAAARTIQDFLKGD